MLEIHNIEVAGLERALKASGNAMTIGEINTLCNKGEYIKPESLNRGKKLGSAKQGSGHDHYLSGIDVYMDIKYPLYWSPEAQRYHWFEIITSQSTMHRLTLAGSKEDFNKMFNKYVDQRIIDIVMKYIYHYNFLNEYSLSEESCNYYHPDSVIQYETKEALEEEKYKYFMMARSNLPSGYEMWMTIKTNYLQLKTMYDQRKNHKLKEDWGAFISMCNNLPLFLDLIKKENN